MRLNVISRSLRSVGYVPFFRNKFPELFQDSDWFFQHSKIHINPLTPKISILILLTVCHTFHIFLLELNRFPKLSRTTSLFPGLSSHGLGKCYNKIPGLSRFSSTRTNPERGVIEISEGLTTSLNNTTNFKRIKTHRSTN